MKKLTFWKSLFLLFALIVGTSTSWADDPVTITWNINGVNTSQTTSGGGQVNTSLKTSSITPSGATGTWTAVSSTATSYASTSSETIAQLGAKNNREFNGTITLSSSSIPATATITNITVTAKSNGSSTLSATVGNATFGTNKTITGSTLTDYSIDGSKTGNNIVLTLSNTTASKYVAISKITVTYTTAAPTQVVKPTINGTQKFLTSTEVSITCDTEGAAIQYTTDNGETWNNYTAAFNLTETTTVKAKATKSGLDDSEEASKTFTKVTPMSVADAEAAIDAAGSSVIEDAWVVGTISQIDGYSNSKYITYWISDDGSTTNQFMVYKGLGINGASFSDVTDLKVGDDVVVKGDIRLYSNKYQFNQDNQLVSRTTKTVPTFSLDETEATLTMGNTETIDVTLTTNTNGTITCKSSNTDVATVALKSAGVYTITAQTAGNATITIKSSTTSTYYPASATVAVTVTDTREDAGISFAEPSVTKTWGQSFTGQTLSNEHSLPVTYSSSDETVATVNASGTVEVLKAGTTTIKATFDGDATYKKAVASYTLTINKAAAGLSFSQTSFDFDLNDGNFTGVAVNNPNSLPVTYASNNEDVAVVIDESSYEILIDASVVGTATITASFTGNDNFNSGSASYTINVLDYSAKGGKYNPYTVAEVNNGTATGTAYVKGFIVGVFQGKDSNATTSGKSNVALSDDPAVISGANTIAVQLPSGTFRDAWNVDENYTIGAEIVVKGSIESYFTSKTGVKSPSEIIPLSVPGKVTSVGYATFSWPYDVDFSAHNALRVYYIDNTDGEKARMAEVASKVVPANTGVLLRGEADSYKGNVTTGATAITGNLLKANTKVKTASADREFYIFANGGNGLGFYPIANATKLGAGKAYIDANDVPAGAKNLVISFDGETTGIANLNVDETANFDANAPMYNLAGQRVTKSYKGVVIVNGKKMLNK